MSAAPAVVAWDVSVPGFLCQEGKSLFLTEGLPQPLAQRPSDARSSASICLPQSQSSPRSLNLSGAWAACKLLCAAARDAPLGPFSAFPAATKRRLCRGQRGTKPLLGGPALTPGCCACCRQPVPASLCRPAGGIDSAAGPQTHPGGCEQSEQGSTAQGRPALTCSASVPATGTQRLQGTAGILAPWLTAPGWQPVAWGHCTVLPQERRESWQSSKGGDCTGHVCS